MKPEAESLTSLEIYHPRPRAGKKPELLLGAFLEEYLKLHISRTVTARLTEQTMRRYLAPFLHRPMGSLTREELVRWHAAIGTIYPTSANRAIIHLNALFNKATEWGVYTGENPCRYVKKFPAVSRSRFVQPGEEMHRLQAALAKEEPKCQAFFILILLTGARRSEARRMTWQDVNLETGLWTRWTTKTRRSHTIRVPDLALARLRALPQLGEYVFTTRTGKPWNNAKIWQLLVRIRTRARLEDVTLHDLRRTCASWMAIHGANLAVIQQVLGHTSLQHTSIYARLNLAPVTDALKANAERMFTQEARHD